MFEKLQLEINIYIYIYNTIMITCTFGTCFFYPKLRLDLEFGVFEILRLSGVIFF